MPDYRRADLAGGTYFFTVNTFRRRAVLIDEPIRLALRQGIELAKRVHPFSIEAWVLLPDHLHCIWTLPPGDAAFSKRWAIIKRFVTQQCGAQLYAEAPPSESRIKRKEGTLWQRRFWEHAIRDEADRRVHVDYIHWNPVKHGYVKHVSDWPYSTFHRFVANGVYPESWGGVDKETIHAREFGE